MTAAWTTEVTTPAFLRGLDLLSLVRRRAVREGAGGPVGLTSRASGLTWVGQRPYQPGDDLRYLDWHLLARLGRPYVRRFHSERSERLDVLLDRSSSMTLGAPPKADVACALAFVFSYVALSAGERVGAFCFADGPVARLQAGRGLEHRARLLEFLSRAPIGGGTAFARSLQHFAARSAEVGRVVVISDLLDGGVETGLSSLRGRGFDVTVIRLRAGCDELPEFDGDALIVDVETGARRWVAFTPADRERYRGQRRTDARRSERFCGQAGIGFANLRSGRPLSDLVFQDLRLKGLLN